MRAEVIDGNRELRFTVDPGRRVVVLGLLGEPVLRFSRSGVWVNRRSPTAAADGLTPRAGKGTSWTRLTAAHSYRWHDHRLTPPADLRPSARRAWELPITVDGRPTAIRGWYERAARPRWWAWLAGIVAAGGALQLAARRVFAERGQVASVLATAAAAAAVISGVAFAAVDVVDPLGAWIQVAATAALALIGSAVCFIRRPSVQRWTAACVGVGVFCIGLSALGAFWHGVVISSLSPWEVRLATAVAVVGGAGAATLGAVAVAGPAGPPQTCAAAQETPNRIF